MASFKDMVLIQKTHSPVVIPTRALTVGLDIHSMDKFGKSQCVIAERRCLKEEDTKVCHSGKTPPHRGSAPGAYPELSNPKIWFWHFHPLFIRSADCRPMLIEFISNWWARMTLFIILPSELGSKPNPPTFVILGKLLDFSAVFFFLTWAIGMLMSECLHIIPGR